METIRGKKNQSINATYLADMLAGYREVAIDLGTGDGRYVRQIANASAATFAIGIDACRENLRDLSRNVPPNALFIIAAANALPHELHSLATKLTINFPWGSLLSGLLEPDPALLAHLSALTKPGASIEVRLNGGAMAEAGQTLETGTVRVFNTLRSAGYSVRRPVTLGPTELRACPTTWARRLAFGRDPRAMLLVGRKM